MQFVLICFVSLVISTTTFSQSVVNWQFYAKKVSDKTYEVHLAATVQDPWHIYSQVTPEGGPVPTKINFNKNPLTALTGTTAENGKLHQKHEEVFGVDVKYFDGKVDFVQVVKLKSTIKTNIAGTIEFMTCNDEQCLPPKTISFSVRLD